MLRTHRLGLQTIREEAARFAGVSVVERNGGKHLRVDLAYNGKTVSLTVSSSPRTDDQNLCNFLRQGTKRRLRELGLPA